MRLKDIEKRTKNRVSNISYYVSWKNGKGTLKYSWIGCIDDYRFNIKKTKEYIEFCNKHRVVEVMPEHCRFEDDPDNEGTVLIYPNTRSVHGFTFFTAKIKDSRFSYDYLVLYNGERIEIDTSKVDPYYDSAWHHLDKVVGLWRGGLVYVSSDCVFLLMPDGRLMDIAPYPERSESGRVNIWMEENTLFIEEYIYCDVDWKHGEWDLQDYDIRKTAIKKRFRITPDKGKKKQAPISSAIC